MIQLNEHALLMCYPDGRVVPLDLTQLVEEVASQDKSGAPPLEPWMVEHIVHSMVHYIRNDLKKEQVTLQDFVELSRDLLTRYLSPEGQRSLLTCDLYEMAQRAGTGFELRFFDILREHISEVAGRGTSAFIFIGLRRCVKFLAGRRRWRTRCRSVHDEVVRFIRETVGRAAPGDIRLSVT